MEVILLQRVEKLGKLGDLVNVRPGYARNFLLPKKIALRATKENLLRFEKEKEALEKLNMKHKDEAETLAKRLENKMVVLIRQASESGQLYGSITSKDVADALKQEHVTKHNVQIDSPIKTIGIHPLRVRLHPEVSIMIRVNAAMSEDEAKAQEKTFEHMMAHPEPEVEAEAEVKAKPKAAKEKKAKAEVVAAEAEVGDAGEEAEAEKVEE